MNVGDCGWRTPTDYTSPPVSCAQEDQITSRRIFLLVSYDIILSTDVEIWMLFKIGVV